LFVIQDSTFEFERKRNRPDRYDRNVTEQTLKAIPLITKIRHERQKKHITERSIAVSTTHHI
jgi:large subunit ribosomal protein L24e